MPAKLKTVHLVLGDCGDYYCEGLHPVAICTTEEKRDEAIERGKKQQTIYVGRRTGRPSPTFSSVESVEIKLDVMPDELLEIKL